MISKTVKTTNGPLVITIPSDRSEITIGMLMDLTPAPGHSYSELEQLAILSGIPSGKEENKVYPDDVTTLCDVLDVEACLSLFADTIQKLAYQIKAFVEVQEIPEAILIPIDVSYKSRWFGGRLFTSEHVGKLVKVITNLGIAPAGAYMEAKEVIKAEHEEYERIKKLYGDIEFNPSIHSMCYLLALYFHGPATGEKFSPRRCVDFQEVIKKLPITKALPIARYFFLRYPNLSRPKITPSLESLKQLSSKRV